MTVQGPRHLRSFHKSQLNGSPEVQMVIVSKLTRKNATLHRLNHNRPKSLDMDDMYVVYQVASSSRRLSLMKLRRLNGLKLIMARLLDASTVECNLAMSPTQAWRTDASTRLGRQLLSLAVTIEKIVEGWISCQQQLMLQRKS